MIDGLERELKELQELFESTIDEFESLLNNSLVGKYKARILMNGRYVGGMNNYMFALINGVLIDSLPSIVRQMLKLSRNVKLLNEYDSIEFEDFIETLGKPIIKLVLMWDKHIAVLSIHGEKTKVISFMDSAVFIHEGQHKAMFWHVYQYMLSEITRLFNWLPYHDEILEIDCDKNKIMRVDR